MVVGCEGGRSQHYAKGFTVSVASTVRQAAPVAQAGFTAGLRDQSLTFPDPCGAGQGKGYAKQSWGKLRAQACWAPALDNRESPRSVDPS